jgi:hypothetical protein
MTRDGKDISTDICPSSDLRSSALTSIQARKAIQISQVEIYQYSGSHCSDWEMLSIKKLNSTVAWEVQDLKDFPVSFFFLSPSGESTPL